MDSRRDWYLGALGVVRYTLRACQGVSLPEIDGSSETKVDAVVDPDPVPRALEVTAWQRIPEPVGQAAQREIPVPPTVLEEPVSFRLGFWQPSPELVVLNVVASGARVTSGQQDMLANLLKAIGHLPRGLSNVEYIDWPLTTGTTAGLQGAREMMGVFLEVKAKLQSFRIALLMGQTAVSLVSLQAAIPGGRISLDCGAEGIVTHSLQDMDTNPALKRETWEAIRHLAGK